MQQPDEIKKKKRSEHLPEPIYGAVQDILASQPIGRIESRADSNRVQRDEGDAPLFPNEL